MTRDRQQKLSFWLNGETVTANADGTALFDGGRVLAVADLHLEKGRALATTAPMPGYDTDATLQALMAAITRDQPEMILFLGDSFHRAHLAETLADAYRAQIDACCAGREVVWLIGNHDPSLPSFLPGRTAAEWRSQTLTFRHIAEKRESGGEVSGHYHPKAKIKTKARGVTGQCFIHDGRRLIMPAFGAYTGGLSVRHAQIARFYSNKAEILFCHGCQIYRYPYSQVSTSPR